MQFKKKKRKNNSNHETKRELPGGLLFHDTDTNSRSNERSK